MFDMTDPKKIFSLEGKVLKLDTAEDIEPYLKELRSMPDVEEVRFQGNTLGIGACEALAKELETKKGLKIANLADIFTGRLLTEIPPALTALLNSLLTLPNLHTVDLSDNAFGLNTQAPLISFLSAHTPLRHLILNNNGLGPKAGALIGEALHALATKKTELSTAATPPPPLETIVCGRNRLENGSMASWARACAALAPGLTELRLAQNGIRQEGMRTLLRDGLAPAATALKVLDVQDNTFTATAARALADAVPRWRALKELGVGDCLLSARGGVMLGDALAEGQNEMLEVLRLQYNDIDAKGVRKIAEAKSWGKVPKLRRVELNGNKFSEEDEAVDMLREGLREIREKHGPPMEEGEHEDWGIDELDELESEEEEEEEEEEIEEEEEREEEEEEKKEQKEEVEEKAKGEVRAAQQAEAENVPQEKDKKVDELADMLGKTGL
ncbi:ran GTPase-activating protein 1 [Lineolata rhizophorae]|uniref:Ran GTPase-activating protein 1 n=1 Tax=Lineolata rhizophorae TaxID=578093 RepID=A0A6A6P9E7_9PEZI|nr:ran GTPase-activating protein 1 [Lineolata rhizophorae]